MNGTIVDTSSFIALAMPFFSRQLKEENFGKSHSLHHLSSSIESVLLSDEIYVDYPSFQRNIEKYTELIKFEEIINYINDGEEDEKKCYEMCREGLLPLINRSNYFFTRLLRTHMSEIQYCELSDNSFYEHSTDWEVLCERLSPGELDLAICLKDKLESYNYRTYITSSAATTLIRFLYYVCCQDIYKYNLSLDMIKSKLLINYSKKRDEMFSRTIIDVFDKEVSRNFDNNYEKWIGEEAFVIKVPMLINYVLRNQLKHKESLIETLIRLRNSKVCKDYRSGIQELQTALFDKDMNKVRNTLAKIENYTLEVNKGNMENPGWTSNAISLTIPFMGGIGVELNIERPKLYKKGDDKILTFLHTISSC
jgi:flagellar biosynthesis/type III secretory pathway chaperone